MDPNLPVDLVKAVAELQTRVAQLEKENSLLRWQLAEGFRDSVRDFSDSLLESLDPGDSQPPASTKR
jgi:hypothetical protein